MQSLLIAALAVAFCGTCIVAMFRFAKQRTQVSRRTETPAPLPWAVTPTALAVLHRRLKRTVAALRLAVPEPGRREEPDMIHDLASHVETLAVRVDRELVMARYMRLTRRMKAFPVLSERVGVIESLADRVVAVADHRQAGVPWDESVREADLRLQALEDAQREVESIDRLLRAGH